MVKIVPILLFVFFGCSKTFEPSKTDLSEFKGVLYESRLVEFVIDTDSSEYVKTKSKIYLTDSLVFLVSNKGKQKMFVDTTLSDQKNNKIYWLSFNFDKKTDAILYVDSKSDSTYIQYAFANKLTIFHNCYLIKE